MIQIENLTFKYKRKKIFTDFFLSIEKGKIYGLLGKNGVGKSTLLYLMTGLLLPQKGKIFFDNQLVSKRYPSTLREIFIVPEEFTLPNISLKKYIQVNSPFYPNFNREQLIDNLKHFELDADMNIDLGTLSMGQKKKVFMSFALATNTSLLMMDEPTNGLDIPGKSQFKKFIASNMSDDRTIIISTHQVQDVQSLIENVIIMEDNNILLNASTMEICQKLYFAITPNNENLQHALYVSPSIGGYHVLLPNKVNQESQLNLELLFNGVLSNPDGIGELFDIKQAFH